MDRYLGLLQLDAEASLDSRSSASAVVSLRRCQIFAFATLLA